MPNEMMYEICGYIKEKKKSDPKVFENISITDDMVYSGIKTQYHNDVLVFIEEEELPKAYAMCLQYYDDL